MKWGKFSMVKYHGKIQLQDRDYDEARGKVLIIKMQVNNQGEVVSASRTIIKSEEVAANGK